MPAGIRIVNTSGTIQYDENFVSLNLVSKFTVNNGGAISAYFDATAAVPVVALKAPGTITIYKVNQISAGVWRYFYLAGQYNMTTTVYVFDNWQNPVSSNGAGFILRNAANQVTFSLTDQKPLRIVGIGYSGMPVPAGRDYACIMTAPGGRYWREFIYGEVNPIQYRDHREIIGFYIYGGAVGITQYEWYASNWSTWSGQPELDQSISAGNILVVDVTNY